MAFVENLGQVKRSDIRLYATRGDVSMGFAAGAVLLLLRADMAGPSGTEAAEPATAGGRESFSTGALVRLTFAGASLVEPVGRGEMRQRNHYFLGNDPSLWRTDVRTFREIVYRDLYPGIDLVYRLHDGFLKYEFMVHPRANPNLIRLTYEGVESLRIEGGELVIHTAVGELRDTAPVASQGDTPVSCGFSILERNSLGIGCRNWDPAEPLLIDPIVYSTFLGGSGLEETSAMAVDASGSAYVVGVTPSVDFPTTAGAFDTSLLSGDAFVAKLDPSASSLLFSTFLGGSREDYARSVGVDRFGGVYVAGWTTSSDFPTSPGASDRGFNGTSDGFVAKLAPSGGALDYATFLGGIGDDLANALALDVWGNAYVVGGTDSSDFPATADAWDAALNGSRDAYLAELNPSGTSLLYATFLGGRANETGFAIARSANAVYVAGATASDDFPTTSTAFDRSFNGAQDAFVTSFDPLLTAIAFSTYLGGDGVEPFGFGGGTAGLAVDGSGGVYLVSSTDSANFPTTSGAFDVGHNGNIDVSVTKINETGAVVYSTFLGGSDVDAGHSIVVDTAGAAYVTGSTTSANFPVTPEAYDPSPSGPEDAFIAVLSPQGDSLRYAGYFGGSGFDRGWSIALDASGDIYLAGNTGSSDFPTTAGVFDEVFNGGFADAFVAKVRPDFADLEISAVDVTVSPPGPVVVGTNVVVQAVVHNIGARNASGVLVRFYDGLPPSTQIGGDQLILLLPQGSSDTASVPWSAGPAGVHTICATSDPDGAIREVSEANNQACVPVSVEPPPGPDLTILPSEIAASPPPPYEPGRQLWITALIRNIGTNGSGATTARFYQGVPPAPQIDGDQALSALPPGGGASVLAPWTPSLPGNFTLCVVADPDDSVIETDERNNRGCIDLFVSETRPDYVPALPVPTSSIITGLARAVLVSVIVRNFGNATPGSSASVAFFNESTPGSPFWVDSIPPVPPAGDSTRITATWTSPSVPGVYRVLAAVDYGDDVLEWNESNNVLAWTVEVVRGPITFLEVGAPNYTTETVYVTSSTLLSLSVLDQSGTGIRSTHLGIDGVWSNYSGPFTLAVDGQHTIEWYSEDFTGNLEPTARTTLVVDDAPPVTTPSHGDGTYDTTTRFSFAATDAGSGVALTELSVDGGAWTRFTDSFTLPPGDHVIGFRSVDNLDNTEPERSLTVSISAGPPPPPGRREPNWKPLVAGAFAVVLALGGAWSSRRSPWSTGSHRRLRAFATFAMPFVLLEGATGIASLSTGMLSIPPVLGLGTAVDLGILVAGLAVFAQRGHLRPISRGGGKQDG